MYFRKRGATQTRWATANLLSSKSLLNFSDPPRQRPGGVDPHTSAPPASGRLVGGPEPVPKNGSRPWVGLLSHRFLSHRLFKAILSAIAPTTHHPDSSWNAPLAKRLNRAGDCNRTQDVAAGTSGRLLPERISGGRPAGPVVNLDADALAEDGDCTFATCSWRHDA